ncbi:ABC transporter permease [Chromobacterium haemolyticum]|uniref:ABC transporter permease n=1 Tax=Chromobacterium haemolyticum TaxID=394935 RepID=UPI0013175D03|nr:iron ABC transporter permease [Chromobacterium haemolyticum]MDH0342678.1 iron ABC transporter permease [Chromobacterium haemolyticum]BBH13553.1 ABC transporter permease [Chromobacterium haemolyticum]
MLSRSSRLLLAAPPLLFLLAMSALPLARLLQEGGEPLSFGLLSDPYLRWRMLWSVLQGGATCLLALLLGVPAAWALARFHFAGRGLALRLLMLPFVMPPLVAGVGVLALFGPQGLSGLDLQDSPWLLLYGNLFFNLPLVIRSAADGFAQVPASRLAAARSLGAGRWRAFWRVEWPAALPWLLPNLCLVFLYCFSGFGLALLLGGQRYATVEVEIYTLVAYELNLADAGALALLSLLVAGGVAAVYAWLEARLGVPARCEPLLPAPARTWVDCAWLTAALAILLIFAGLPLLAVLWKALSALDSLTGLWDEELRLALFNSTHFTLLTVLLSGVLGLCHALATGRWLWLRALAFLPFVVSPVCVAFGLLLLYPSWSADLAMLLAAYVLLAYPFVAKAIGVALDSMPEHLAQAARSLGASPWRLFRRVIWPLLQPALRRGLAFAAATAVGEFAVTLFLSRPEWLTLTTLIYQKLGRPGQANADAAMLLSGLLMVLATLAFAVIESSAARPGEPEKGDGRA